MKKAGNNWMHKKILEKAILKLFRKTEKVFKNKNESTSNKDCVIKLISFKNFSE